MGRRFTRFVIEKRDEKLFFRIFDPNELVTPGWATEDEATKFRTEDAAASYLREFGLLGRAHVRERHYKI